MRVTSKLTTSKISSSLYHLLAEDAKVQLCVDDDETICTYTGELNERGEAHGKGTADDVDDPDYKYKGTFRDGKFHGLSKWGSMLMAGCSDMDRCWLRVDQGGRV